MEPNIRSVEPEKFAERLSGLLQETESVPLVISGNSMLPFLIHGRDTVYLSKVKEPLKKGDIIFYRRENGAYILHRICKVKDGAFDMIGDAQPVIERGIRQEQVIAKVNMVCRKGKNIKKGDLIWVFFEKIWLNIIPLRAFLIGLYTKMKK